MNKKDFISYIENSYGISADFPWIKSPDSMVFRHTDNRKWFALVMTVSKDKIGFKGTGIIDIANLKCDPILIGFLIVENGFFPAYHMNKQNWITVLLNDTIEAQKTKMLIDLSYNLTSLKHKN